MMGSTDRFTVCAPNGAVTVVFDDNSVKYVGSGSADDFVCESFSNTDKDVPKRVVLTDNGQSLRNSHARGLHPTVQVGSNTPVLFCDEKKGSCFREITVMGTGAHTNAQSGTVMLAGPRQNQAPAAGRPKGCGCGKIKATENYIGY